MVEGRFAKLYLFKYPLFGLLICRNSEKGKLFDHKYTIKKITKILNIQ